MWLFAVCHNGPWTKEGRQGWSLLTVHLTLAPESSPMDRWRQNTRRHCSPSRLVGCVAQRALVHSVMGKNNNEVLTQRIFSKSWIRVSYVLTNTYVSLYQENQQFLRKTSKVWRMTRFIYQQVNKNETLETEAINYTNNIEKKQNFYMVLICNF